MKYRNLIFSILLLLAVGYIYNKFQINVNIDDKIEDLNIIKKYLLNTEDATTINKLSSIRKPIIWIHIEYDRNLRKWESFASRSSEQLNQDYLYLTLRSIINKCGNDFHIVLIDDQTFTQLLDNWNIDLKKLGNIQKENMRLLALMKILYKYGGILMEPSFIAFKSLAPIYNMIKESNTPCVGEFANDSANNHIMSFGPSLKFVGCLKNCEKINSLEKHLAILLNNDNTNESKIEGQITNYLYKLVSNGSMNMLDGKYLGTKDSNNKNIDISRLIGCCYLDLHEDAYGLYIPHKDLLKRKAYNWFVYLNVNEILKSNTNVGKYLLISN